MNNHACILVDTDTDKTVAQGHAEWTYDWWVVARFQYEDEDNVYVYGRRFIGPGAVGRATRWLDGKLGSTSDKLASVILSNRAKRGG